MEVRARRLRDAQGPRRFIRPSTRIRKLSPSLPPPQRSSEPSPPLVVNALLSYKIATGIFRFTALSLTLSH